MKFLSKKSAQFIGSVCAIQGAFTGAAMASPTIGSMGTKTAESGTGVLSLLINLATLGGAALAIFGIFSLWKGRSEGGDKGRAISFIVLGALLPVFKVVQGIILATAGVPEDGLDGAYNGIGQ